LLGVVQGTHEDWSFHDPQNKPSTTVSSGHALGGIAFPEKWQRAQMAAEIPEEERATAAEVEHLQEIAGYLGSAATVLEVDLVELERPPEIRETLRRETARASVHRFENSGDAAGDAA